MKPHIMKQMVNDASHRAGPISAIVDDVLQGSTDHGVLNPAALADFLTAGGYVIAYTDAANWAWAKVYDAGESADSGGVVRAQGYSADRGDALLQAAFGAVREERAATVVSASLEEAGLQVTPELRQKLESRFILEGGSATLARDLEQMTASKAQLQQFMR